MPSPNIHPEIASVTSEQEKLLFASNPMTISENFQQRFDRFSVSMDFSPNRDHAIYYLVHAALLLVAAIFVLVGFAVAVWPVVVLALALTGQDYWQVRLSRRSALAGCVLLALYIIGLLYSVFFVGSPGLWDILVAVATVLLAATSLGFWYWAADRLYNAHFRLPPENSGPW